MKYVSEFSKNYNDMSDKAFRQFANKKILNASKTKKKSKELDKIVKELNRRQNKKIKNTLMSWKK